jgi:hypothetical protein
LDNIKHFSDKELCLATDNYHLSNKIGRGGFGTVFQGTLKDGRKVAVKPLSVGSKQGVREFLTEINTLSYVKHENLVELVGFCVQGPNRTVVYEYVENGNLHTALLGRKKSNIKLEWTKRSAICVGTAKGLAYLHEELPQHIVHRDIKASNVLLDKDFNPKIGDFGMAKLFPDDITHISTRIAGTTFGVLLLEIISGKSSSRTNWEGSQKSLLEWAWYLHEEEKWLELVDKDMEEFSEKDVIKYIKVALFCTQAAAKRRPLMTQVVDMLTKDIQLNEKQLTAPGLFNTDLGESSQKKSNPESLVYHTSSTEALASITEVTAR